MEYAGFDLVAARVDSGGARHEFTYDTELRLTSVVNPQGLVWSYRRDAAGRLVEESDFNGRTVYVCAGLALQIVPLRPRISRWPSPEKTTAGSVGATAVATSRAR